MNITIDNSLAGSLKLLKPTISPHLIAPECWHQIESIAAVLPSAITSFFGFECRMGKEEAHADFLICAKAKQLGRKVLADDEYPVTLPQYLYDSPVWQQINNFSQQWNNPDSPLYQGVNNIWLEFDIDESLANIPVPSCFFGPQPIYSYSDARWTIDRALKLLQNKAVPQATAAQILNCFELLPENAYVFQIGVMLARKSDLARICIRNISPEATLEYLTALNWSGSIDGLKQTLEELSTYADRIDLDIDVGESVLPKIGLECYLEKQPKFNHKWELFLDYLVESGFCTEQKRASLLDYTGYMLGQPKTELPDNDSEEAFSLADFGYQRIFFKGLHHVKLTYQEAEAQEAKAYLYVDRQLITSEFVESYRTFKNSTSLSKLGRAIDTVAQAACEVASLAIN